jgi:hypothetical protein
VLMSTRHPAVQAVRNLFIGRLLFTRERLGGVTRAAHGP